LRINLTRATIGHEHSPFTDRSGPRRSAPRVAARSGSRRPDVGRGTDDRGDAPERERVLDPLRESLRAGGPSDESARRLDDLVRAHADTRHDERNASNSARSMRKTGLFPELISYAGSLPARIIRTTVRRLTFSLSATWTTLSKGQVLSDRPLVPS